MPPLDDLKTNPTVAQSDVLQTTDFLVETCGFSREDAEPIAAFSRKLIDRAVRGIKEIDAKWPEGSDQRRMAYAMYIGGLHQWLKRLVPAADAVMSLYILKGIVEGDQRDG